MNLKVGAGQATGSVQSATAMEERPPAAETKTADVFPKKDASDPHKMKAETALTGQMRAVSLNAAVAEKDAPKVGQNQPVDITSSQEARNGLLRSAPQINPISTAQGNGPSLCGGAAVANALILSSKTPEKAKANAQAVQDLAGSLKPPLKMSGDEQAALKRFEKGVLSPQDAQQMQQVMYRMAQRMPIGGQSNPNLMGVSTSQVATTIAALKSHGAFKDSSVTMHCNRLPNGFDHWTTTVDGTHANSQGPNNKSMIQGGPPPELSRNNGTWQNEIWLNPWSEPVQMSVQYKNGNDKPNEYREAIFQADKYREQESFIDLEERLFKAKKLVDD